MEIEIVRIPVSNDNRGAMLELVESARAEGGYLAAPGCVGADATVREAELVVVVRWASRQAHEQRMHSDRAGPFVEALGKLASGPPAFELLEPTFVSGRLDHVVALVTGGGGGIGRAVVDAFIREGARVGVVDVQQSLLDEVAKDHGNRVHCVCADLGTLEGNRRVVAETVAAFGRLDTFVGNAGLFDGFFEFANVDSETLDAGIEKLFRVNVKGLILGCREALPHLVKTRGSIIVTLSNASLYPDGGGIAYVASKHAGLGVVRQLAHELAPAVRVNGVAPGATRTAIGVPDEFGGPMDQTAPEMSEAISKLVPVGFHAEPADHAEAFVLLAASAESRAMTGTVIESDGGLGVRGLRRTRGGDALLAD